MNLDKEIFEAVSGSPVEKPTTLWQIIGYVDSRQRLMISYDELFGGLKRLFEARRIGEVDGKYFAMTSEYAASSPRDFKGFSQETFKKAQKEYRKRFWKAFRELKKKQSP